VFTDAMQITSMTVDPAVASQVKEQVLEAFRALPKRGIEVGGVLFGRITGEDPVAVHVDGFEPAPCEHRFGPSFTLSEQDRAGLEEILTRRRDVVGYFRSCTGRELALDTADEELIEAYFRRSAQVCLCVAPVSARDCVATVFSWRNGQPPRQAGPVILFDSLPAEPVRAETPQPEPPPPAVEPPPVLPAPRDQRGWPWLFVLVLAIGCAFLYERWQSARTEWPSRLGLEVQHTHDGVELRWDASSPAVKGAGRGLLSITRDGSQDEIELDAATVHSGLFPYKESGKDLLFRLTVYGPEMRAATESFRIVAVAQPPSAPLEETKPEEPEPEPQPPQQETPAPAPEPAVAAVPPVAIHEVQPGISDGIRARIEKPVVVPVDVEISASGRVASAVPQAGGDPLYRYLAERAAGAARAWRFQPARSRNGTPVPSSKTLYFVFRG
jgi:hypothetical protein